jgi:hypothetical protein
VAAAAAAVTTDATELCKRETVEDFYAQISKANGPLEQRQGALAPETTVSVPV